MLDPRLISPKPHLPRHPEFLILEGFVMGTKIALVPIETMPWNDMETSLLVLLTRVRLRDVLGLVQHRTAFIGVTALSRLQHNPEAERRGIVAFVSRRATN